MRGQLLRPRFEIERQTRVLEGDPGVGCQILEERAFGGAKRVVGRLHDRDVADGLARVVDAEDQRGLGDVGVRRPRCRARPALLEEEPDSGGSRAHPSSRRLGHVGEYVIRRGHARHPMAELRHDLVRGGAAPVHDPVRHPLEQRPGRLHADRDEGGRGDPESLALRVADQRTDAHDEPHVDRSDAEGQRDVRDRLGDDDVDVEAVRRAYVFEDLQSFLDIYYQGMSVLLREVDFYELAMAYFRKAASQTLTDNTGVAGAPGVFASVMAAVVLLSASTSNRLRKRGA